VPAPPGEGGEGGPWAVAAKFYRVVRTPRAGYADGWGPFYTVPESPMSNLIAVCAGPRERVAHCLALDVDSRLSGWGDNTWGQCAVPEGLPRVAAFAAGARHSVVALRDGRVVAWGDNRLGQTNVPPDLTNVVDVKAGLWHSIALRADGTVAVWGDLFTNNLPSTVVAWGDVANLTNAAPADATNVAAIAAGPRSCLVLQSNGALKAWGFDWACSGTGCPRTACRS